MSWLLPTRRRLPALRRFLRSIREMGVATDGYVLVNKDELERDRRHYDELDLPKGWRIEGVENDRCMFDALRWAWTHLGADTWPWVGLVTDDLIPGSQGWDTSLVQAATGINVVSANPMSNTARMHGAIVWSGDLLRALNWGGPYPQGFNHWYGDDVWENIGRETGCWQVLDQVVTKHVHVFQHGVVDDTANHVNSNAQHDKARFEQWMQNEKDWSVETIRKLQQSRGVKTFKPDFAGVRLLIASPSNDGRYHDTFMIGLFQAMGLLQQHGAKCDFIQEKYNADISLARSRLFDAFLRSTATHMLMIDSDMGWNIDAIIRLFTAKKDVVAIAGPKKSYPLRFAANHSDRAGNPLPLMMDMTYGCCEVTEVGAAFMLITRNCAEKVAKAYPELEFEGLTSEPEHAVFMPLVMQRKYKSEDFAFCQRWVAIGGKVYIVPDVPLKHSGQHTFEGRLTDQAGNVHNPVADHVSANLPQAKAAE